MQEKVAKKEYNENKKGIDKMADFGTTSNGSFETSKKWSGIQKHLEHDENVNHENKYLNTEESKRLKKYNETIDLVNFDDWTEKHFKNYVFEHDKKNLEKSRFVFGSVKNFLRVDTSGKTRKKSLDKLYLMKFSNEEDYQKLFKKVKQSFKDEQKLDDEKSEEKAILLFRTSLENYTKGFNKRNSNIVAFKGKIHMDEEGAPHVHLRTMPFVPPKKPTEKPKWSINQALRTQFKQTDTRKNMKKFREQEDTSMIDCVNEEIEKQLPKLSKNLHLKLTRKEQTESVTHEVYREREHLKDVQKQVEIEQKKLEETKKKNEELDKRENSLNQRENDLTVNEERFTRKNNSLQEHIQRYNSIVATSKQQFKDKNEEINKKNETVDNKINELNQQINEVKSLKQRLQERFDKFEKKTKNVVRNWRNFAIDLATQVYNKVTPYIDDFALKHNDATDELDYYNEHIDEIPSDFDENEWFKHKDDKQFSWLVSHNDDEIIKRAEKTVEEHKKQEKSKKDLNNDGIDDSQENILPTIDATEFDPLLQLNNEENKEQQDENEKN